MKLGDAQLTIERHVEMIQLQIRLSHLNTRWLSLWVHGRSVLMRHTVIAMELSKSSSINELFPDQLDNLKGEANLRLRIMAVSY